jgi:hypothetical protein
MFVLCPHCQFLVGLETATGRPPERCPRCNERLLPADPPAARPEADVAADAVPAPPAVDDAIELPTAPDTTDAETSAAIAVPAPAAAEPPATSGQASAPAPTLPPASPDPAPAASEPKSIAPAIDPVAATLPGWRRWLSTPRARRRLQLASVPLLSLLLLLQCVLANRAQLAADARWRPLVAGVCATLPCTLPSWHEPAAFTLLDRTVRPDPRRPGVLHVTAGFRNDANWPQDWPSLALTLSDADGRIAGARVFAPNEYLAPLPTQEAIASGQRARVALDLVEPANHPVAFTFDFR